MQTSTEYKILKGRAAEKEKSKYGKKNYKNKSKELNLLQAEADHQKSKYEKLNKAFTKRKTSKEETVNTDKFWDRNSSPRNESKNSSTKNGKTSIAYDSDSADND